MITTYKINKLDCQSCAMVIEGICEDTSGVQKAEVNSIKRILKVEHDESVKPEQLKQELAQEGYSVDTM